MLNILKYYKLWFVVSGLILLFGIGSLSIYGLNLGIDFKGGTLTEIKFERPYDLKAAESAVKSAELGNFQLQPADNNTLLIKTVSAEKEKHDLMLTKIREMAGDFTEQQFQSIGPLVGKELAKNAFYQLLLVSLGIVFYIAYAFRKVPKPFTSWKFGLAAIIALLHDLVFVLGVFSLLGHFKGVEVDSMFVTALLTVLGFSVHDTIVVFDRIRENLKFYASQSIEFVVNHSIAQTIVRSLNTSLTVLFVLLALLLFGGETIRYFVLALFVGIIVGTYSSIFIASPALMIMQKKK
ncbi:MAG: protein translocase subunit SecF [Candidatus Doudnabacteria bacterium]|nr:protein translocase subunit SecF [Candidatus Doudnabacteria bacterium]